VTGYDDDQSSGLHGARQVAVFAQFLSRARGMVDDQSERSPRIMMRRSFSLSFLVVSLTLAAGLACFAPSAQGARSPHRKKVFVNLQDTGRTVVVPVGQDLVVTVPLRPFDDNYWSVVRNSGDGLRLIAGPDEKRGRNWASWKPSSQIFYFRKDSPGVAHLVMEQSYWSKPMILEVVDQ
jgi:hypothetical protein